MRITSVFLIMVLILGTAMANGRNSDIDVDIAVKIGGPNEPTRGSGGFVVEEDGYGRVSLTFPQDVSNFGITSYGAKQGPVTRILGDKAKTSPGNKDIALMTDIYLKPSVTEKGEIRLQGAMINMTRGTETRLYDYSEEKIDFVLSKEDHHFVKLNFPAQGKDIFLDITANSSADLIYTPKTTIYATLKSEYSLFNQDSRKFEMQECQAELGFSGDDEKASGSTSNWKMFDLPDGDSLLFISSFEIDKPKWESDGSMTFDFDLIHIYSINPEIVSPFPSEINGEKTTIVTLSKNITISPGEKAEIEIPSSKNSLLPFKSKETIMVTYEMEKR